MCVCVCAPWRCHHQFPCFSLYVEFAEAEQHEANSSVAASQRAAHFPWRKAFSFRFFCTQTRRVSHRQLIGHLLLFAVRSSHEIWYFVKNTFYELKLDFCHVFPLHVIRSICPFCAARTLKASTFHIPCILFDFSRSVLVSFAFIYCHLPHTHTHTMCSSHELINVALIRFVL